MSAMREEAQQADADLAQKRCASGANVQRPRHKGRTSNDYTQCSETPKEAERAAHDERDEDEDGRRRNIPPRGVARPIASSTLAGRRAGSAGGPAARKRPSSMRSRVNVVVVCRVHRILISVRCTHRSSWSESYDSHLSQTHTQPCTSLVLSGVCSTCVSVVDERRDSSTQTVRLEERGRTRLSSDCDSHCAEAGDRGDRPRPCPRPDRPPPAPTRPRHSPLPPLSVGAPV